MGWVPKSRVVRFRKKAPQEGSALESVRHRFRWKVPQEDSAGRFRRKVPQEGSAGRLRRKVPQEVPKGGFAGRFREKFELAGSEEVFILEASKDGPKKKVLERHVSIGSSDNDPTACASGAPKSDRPQSCAAEDSSSLSSSDEVPPQPAKSGEAKNKALLNAALQKSKDKKKSKPKVTEPGSKISPWGSPWGPKGVIPKGDRGKPREVDPKGVNTQR